MLVRRRERRESKRAPAEGPAAAEPSAAAMEQQAVPAGATRRQLGDLLRAENLLSAEQLDAALAVQQEKGGFLGKILVEMGYVTQEEVASCLVRQCQIPHLSLLDYDIGPSVAQLVPEEVCKKHNLIPIDKLGKILTVAMVNPLDLDALETVQRVCPALRVKPILCNWEHFELVLQKVFGGPSREEADAELTARSLGLAGALRDKRPERTPQPAGGSTKTRDAKAAPPRPGLERTASPPGAGSVTAREPAARVYDGVRGAAARGTEQSAGKENVEAGPLPGGARARDMAEMVRDGVNEALGDALAGFFAELRARTTAEKEQAPSIDEFAEIIRDGVGTATEEAMAELLVQLRAMTPKGDRESAEPMATVLAEMIRETRTEIAQSLRETLEASRDAQALQGSQLAEIAEAILQSVQEASLRAGRAKAPEGKEELRPKRKQEKLSTVAAFRSATKGKKEAPLVNPEAQAESDGRVRDLFGSGTPSGNLRFENFFPGAVNAFTFKLSQAVASGPGSAYNPFFLFGHVGVGKTHLITAIGNAIVEQQPGLRVGYVSASHFSQSLSEAIKKDALEAFRDDYCHWDVLILDDIQFSSGRVEAQEEFFHVFNVLHEEGRQIIIASDTPPDRLGLMEKRLVSRFSSGIVAELKTPEWETRMAILRRYAEQNKAEVREEVLSLIAMRECEDVRMMVGALHKIVAFARLVDQTVSSELAEEILSHLGTEEES